MDIDELTLREIRQIGELLNLQWNGASPQPFEIGKCYCIRTVTMIDTGRIVSVTPQWIVVEEAAWIADTGRFSDAIEKAEFDEVEPFPDGKIVISCGAVIDACQIKKLPRNQK